MPPISDEEQRKAAQARADRNAITILFNAMRAQTEYEAWLDEQDGDDEDDEEDE